ncbi:nucleoside triphosphate pyrophosphohydrolase [Paraglaciecola aestuariivivens]
MSIQADPSSQLARLLNIMQKLRDPELGCPWDLAQDFASIVPHTIEETYELAEAILAKDMPEVKDELGDLLFQVVFYAQLAKEQQQFDFEDIAQSISDKLVRRHPHVFTGADTKNTDALNQQWDKIKQQERRAAGKAEDSSILANIPNGLTPLLKAQKIQKKCAQVGFDWNELAPVVAKIHEEVDEVLAEIHAPEPNQQAIEEEIGDLLFATVNLARHTQVNAETALIKANQKFEQRFRQVEQQIQQQGLSLSSATLEQMEAAWQQVKAGNNQ